MALRRCLGIALWAIGFALLQEDGFVLLQESGDWLYLG